MKVILLKEVPKLGKRGEIKDVADGFGRNMLIRNKLAELATEDAIKKVEEQSKSQTAEKKRIHEIMHALRAALMERGIVIKKKGNEISQKGAGQEVSLYAAVSPREILEALNVLKFPLPENMDESMVVIETPIKTLGLHEAKIKIGAEATVVKIEVRELKKQ